MERGPGFESCVRQFIRTRTAGEFLHLSTLSSQICHWLARLPQSPDAFPSRESCKDRLSMHSRAMSMGQSTTQYYHDDHGYVFLTIHMVTHQTGNMCTSQFDSGTVRTNKCELESIGKWQSPIILAADSIITCTD